MTLFTLFMVLAPLLTFETLTIAELGDPDAVSPVQKYVMNRKDAGEMDFDTPAVKGASNFP
jgi:hypothetical protein